MIKTALEITRDIFLACTLIALVQIAIEHNVSFLLEHANSVTHELDRDFIDQIYTAQRQIHMLTEHPEYGITFEATIADIKNKLSDIENKYKKNSPALALLGPIGTASTVLKEQELNKKLLTVLNELSLLLHTINNKQEAFETLLTINDALDYNKASLISLT
jgi:hypothetical protein